MLAPLASISSHSAISHSFFTVSHCKMKEVKRKRNVWDEKHESLGHLNCFLNMSLCCQYRKVVVSFINKESFSHYKVKIITTFSPIFYKKSNIEKEQSRENMIKFMWENTASEQSFPSHTTPRAIPNITYLIGQETLI